MQASLVFALNAARRARQAAIVLTDQMSGETRLILERSPERNSLDDTLATEVTSRFRCGTSGSAEIDGRPLFFNVHLPSPRIAIIGAVHISQALAPMAAIAGFAVTVIDPRTAFATPERFAGIDLVTEWPQDAFALSPLDAHTALVAVTHDPKIDDPALLAGFDAGAFYIGALGSRKTHAKRVERLTAAGVAPADIDRMSAPIGLDIGAATPAEIAVAVLADVIRALRQRVVQSPGADG
ncbi:XdhC family protein [Rhizobium sp. G187]|uniref:XdhC family protein n=1 Tax=Rhizobium sp. G187 TaxID=3451352 RepID=UPI003EE59017